MKVSVIYNSHTGTTMGFAKSIATYLEEKGQEVGLASIDSYDEEFLATSDLVLLGSWTSGLFFFAQHPDKPWKIFARRMPSIEGKTLVLFTTYKLATGSMFRNMEKHLKGKAEKATAILKSKSRELNPVQKADLDKLIHD